MSIPWPTTKPPAQSSPSRPSASSFSSTAVTSQPSRSSWSATCEPTRPQPMTIAFMRLSVAQRLVRRRPPRARPAGRRRPAPRRAPCAGRSRPSGEKKRDCRRQRGAEPSTIRSAPRSRRPRRRSPRRSSGRGRSRPATSTPWSAPSSRASASDAAARSSSLVELARRAAGRAARGSRTAPRRRAPRSWASLTAVASISSPIGPSFIGTRMLENVRSRGSALGRRVDVLEQALAARPADEPRRRRAPATSQAGPP